VILVIEGTFGVSASSCMPELFAIARGGPVSSLVSELRLSCTFPFQFTNEPFLVASLELQIHNLQQLFIALRFSLNANVVIVPGQLCLERW